MPSEAAQSVRTTNRRRCGRSPMSMRALVAAIQLRDAMRRYDRQWHERESLQDVRSDQDDEREQCDERAGTANPCSDANACVGVASSGTSELDRL